MIRALYLEVNGIAPHDVFFTNEVADKSFDVDMVIDEDSPFIDTNIITN